MNFNVDGCVSMFNSGKMNVICSKGLSWTLDRCGYSAQQREIRRLVYKALDNYFDNVGRIQGRTIATVGSKGEGLSKYMESDFDKLVYMEDLVCADKTDVARLFQDDRNVLMTHWRKDFPGHVLIEANGRISPKYVVNVKTSEGHMNVVSSKKLVLSVTIEDQSNRPYTDFVIRNITRQPPAGPSVPLSTFYFNFDMVQSIRYLGTALLYEWDTRQRSGHWPSVELRRRVMQLGANLVPTGCDGSDLKEHEWRICFNEGETLLVISWNDCMSKLYILLKMVLKDVIKAEGKVVTSYVMKNIVFWLAEKHPQEDFAEENLYDWVVRAFKMLQDMLKEGKVPYYMIPDRNLMAGKGNPTQIRDIVQRIDLAIKAGPYVFFLCPKLKEAMEMGHERLEALSHFRNDLEMIMLRREVMYMMSFTPNMSCEERLKINFNRFLDSSPDMLKIVSIKWEDYIKSHGSDFYAYAFMLIKHVLS